MPVGACAVDHEGAAAGLIAAAPPPLLAKAARDRKSAYRSATFLALKATAELTNKCSFDYRTQTSTQRAVRFHGKDFVAALVSATSSKRG